MNKRSTITLSGKEYKTGFSFLAIRLFEEMTSKSIQQQSGTWDNLIYCYCTVKALNEDFLLTFDQFTDLLDENPQLLLDIQFATVQNEPVELHDSTAKTDIAPKKKGLIKTFFLLWIISALLLASPVLIPIIFGLIWISGSLKALYRHIASRGSKRVSSFKPSPENA